MSCRLRALTTGQRPCTTGRWAGSCERLQGTPWHAARIRQQTRLRTISASAEHAPCWPAAAHDHSCLHRCRPTRLRVLQPLRHAACWPVVLQMEPAGLCCCTWSKMSLAFFLFESHCGKEFLKCLILTCCFCLHQAHKAEDFKWWSQRLGRSFQLYDETRVDHFRGFAGGQRSVWLLHRFCTADLI